MTTDSEGNPVTNLGDNLTRTAEPHGVAVGIPDHSMGEEVGAAVALTPGAELGVEELQTFAKDRLAAYTHPRVVRIVDELPQGPTGTILRRKVGAPEGGSR